MTPHYLLDTEVIIRHLIDDESELGGVVDSVFEQAQAGKLKLRILSPVLSECVMILESHYKKTRAETTAALKKLLANPRVDIPQPAIHVDALERYGKSTMHFVDCMLAAHAYAAGYRIITFNNKLERFIDHNLMD